MANRLAELITAALAEEAAAPSEADRKLEAFELLLSEVSTALANVVDKLENGDGAKMVADALRALQLKVDVAAPAVTFEPRIDVAPTPVAIHNEVHVAPTPVVMHCDVPPAPAPVFNFLPAPEKAVTWEVRLPGLYGAPDRVMTITRKS